jgi:hypothetical protein
VKLVQKRAGFESGAQKPAKISLSIVTGLMKNLPARGMKPANLGSSDQNN